MRALKSIRGFVVGATVLAVLVPAGTAFAYSDVPSSYWDATQINYVASWMSDYGSSTFKPHELELRKFFARSIVKMFAPTEPVDGSIKFDDLPSTDPFYPYANVAVKLGWMDKWSGNRFGPNGLVPRSAADQALVLALGLHDAVDGLAKIHGVNGQTYDLTDPRWAHMQLAAYLDLHFNHSIESLDLQPTTRMPRDEVAYSLWRAKTVPSWLIDATSRFETITLPSHDMSIPLQAVRFQLTEYALNQIGYPYIWGGEWYQSTVGTDYCCGDQPQGGFDCSGFVWWVLKKAEGGYDSAQFRDYPGWSIPQRTSSTMAQYTSSPVTFGHLAAGYIMFFASDGGSTYSHVDHVGIYVGNNWMVHSTSGGPQLEYVGSGWYHDHFVYGRAIAVSAPSAATAKTAAPEAGPQTNATAGDSALTQRAPSGR